MAQGYATFGDFLLLKKRSEDALGSLWRAGEMEATGFKRIVWLRRFDQSGFDRQALAAEFPLAEEIGKTLKATNVVSGATVGKADGVPFLAWDYFPGQPLDQLLARVQQEQFPVAIDNCLLIAEKLAAALSAALALEHQGEPVIHGFLVPHLVVLSNDGEARVAGFGLARGLLANLDRVGMQELAAPYLAPEVLATGHPSRRGDVYSLGAILYQLLAGQPLSADPQARAQAVAQPQLALDEGPVPDDVAAVLRKALATRPEERYSSAVDFKRDLEKLLYGGAYAPTTFNLALFMDRLYRQEIEDEDRELQREKTLDVTPYYRPAKAPSAPAPAAVAAAPGSRVGLYVAIGVIVVLAGALGYLLTRPKGPSEEETRRQVQAMVMEELAKREEALRQELERSRQETEALKQQLADIQKKAATGAQKLTPEEQKRLEEAQRLLAQREEERRRTEAELARVQQEKARAVVAPPVAAPTAVPTVAPTPTPVPVEVAAAPSPIPTVAPSPTPEPTKAPVVAQAPAPAPAAPAGRVQENQFFDPSEVDTLPEKIVEAKPELPMAATRARVNQKATVIVKVVVNARGVVEDAEILRGFPVAGLGIDEACIAAAKKHRFRPATKGGVRVKTTATLTFFVDLTK
ncbi:TonB family protein [Thermoanaerobaculum aquaticum]|nr:TonB family protein [Thermoanaerobaculum aquaticum]